MLHFATMFLLNVFICFLCLLQNIIQQSFCLCFPSFIFFAETLIRVKGINCFKASWRKLCVMVNDRCYAL